MTIGVDLGDRKSKACVLDGNAEVVEELVIRTTPEGIERSLGGRQPARVAIEVGTHSPWVSRLLKRLGHEVLVANPRQVRLIYAGRRKNDRLDAHALARLARLDPKLLGPVRHRGPQAQADLAVLHARDLLVGTRTRLVNHVRGVVKSSGVRLGSCSAASFARKMSEKIPEPLRPALEPIMKSIEQLNEQIAACDRLIEQRSREVYPQTQALTQVAGVGPVTALAFVLTLDDPRRFSRSRDVAAYLGLTPRQKQSGMSDPQMRISKAGSPFVRRLLVVCAHYILGPFGPDTDLKRWGLALATRGGANAKKRAVVAVARRLAVLLHRLWLTGEEYVPLGYGRARAAKGAAGGAVAGPASAQEVRDAA
jgi:transposase